MKPGENRYDLRPHSLRKFFKTQLVAKYVPESIVDYMMGHVTDTYNDVQALGVEHLRQFYAAAHLSIRPSQEDSLTRTLVSLLRAAGKDPEKYLRKEALAEPNRIVVDRGYTTEEQAQALLAAIRDYVVEDIMRRS